MRANSNLRMVYADHNASQYSYRWHPTTRPDLVLKVEWTPCSFGNIEISPEDIDSMSDADLVEVMREAASITHKEEYEYLIRCQEAENAKEAKRSQPRPKRVSSPIVGYIYLIQSSTGTYKIGRAKNVKNRIKLFSIKLPFEINLIHTIPCKDYIAAELSLHKIYANKRINGEWFALNETDVATIKEITEL